MATKDLKRKEYSRQAKRISPGKTGDCGHGVAVRNRISSTLGVMEEGLVFVTFDN